ncbi:MAG: Rieske (2Fe-2S) protein [Planctomycetes bacterium]|nr:Rieske (2Fe-2S) protein [Planctomycetota bacterium]
MSYQPVGKIADFPEGKGTEVRLGPRRIGIYQVHGEFFAVKNICPHQKVQLTLLPPEGCVAVCKGHGWRFDLHTGECLQGERDARVATYPVKVDGDTVLVDVG